MERIYEMIFSESENVMYEINNGKGVISITCGEIRSEIERKSVLLAHRLDSMPSEVRTVGLCMENSLEWIELFWSILKCGREVLLLNPGLSADRLNEAASACGAGAVIAGNMELSVPVIEASSITGEKNIAADEKPVGLQKTKRINSTESADVATDNSLAEADCNEKKNGFGNKIYVMSPGTSGSCRILGYNGDDLREQVTAVSQLLSDCGKMKGRADGQQKYLMLYPYYHIFGLSAYLGISSSSHIIVGIKDMRPKNAVGLIKQHEVTHVFAAPSFLEKLCEYIIGKIRNQGDKAYSGFKRNIGNIQKTSGFPLIQGFMSKRLLAPMREKLFGASLCCLISCGGELRQQTTEFFSYLGCRLLSLYGTSETGVTAAETNKNPGRITEGFIGKSGNQAEYKLDDEGRLMIRSKGTASFSYADGEWRTVGKDEWIKSDDLAEGAGGRFRLLGRYDDVITASTGKRLYPNSIENGFVIDGVRDVCLIEAKVKDRCAPVLIVSTEEDISPEGYVGMCKLVHERILKGGLGTELKDILYTRDELVEAGNLKRSRRRIREAYENRLYTPVLSGKAEGHEAASLEKDSHGTELSADLIRAVRVREMAANILDIPKNRIDYDTDLLSELEAGSMDYFTFLCEIEEEFHVTLSDDVAEKLRTVRKICDYLRNAKKR